MKENLFKVAKYNKFGRLLAKLAIANDIKNQSELARAIRSNSTHVHSILVGKVTPNSKFMKKIKMNLWQEGEIWDNLYSEAIKLNGWMDLK